MPVYTYLDLVTNHLPQAEMDAITEAPVLTRAETEYGIWVHVDQNPEEPVVQAEEEDWASFLVLRSIIEYARAKGCFWINFDRDAEEEEGLATFNW